MTSQLVVAPLLQVRYGAVQLDRLHEPDAQTVIDDLLVRYVEAPDADPEAQFALLVTLIESDNFLGRILTGKIESGTAKVGMPVKALSLDGKLVEQGRITKLQGFRGIERIAVNEAEAGDIISIAGLTTATVADTIGAVDLAHPLKANPIDPPTMAITIAVNDSPLAGTEGTKVTSRMIRDRLFREAESNVAIRVTESADKDSFEVAGRGELQLGVLIEGMRREGFELSISRPRVVYQTGRAIWDQTPLPSHGLRPSPLPAPQPQDPCLCGSGLRFQRCCAGAAPPSGI